MKLELSELQKNELIDELSKFIRGFVFLKPFEPARELVKKIETIDDLAEYKTITIDFQITIDTNLVIGMIGSILSLNKYKNKHVSKIGYRKDTLQIKFKIK